MATYKGIKGVKVVTKTSDPTASEADGTVWYNSTGDALKYAIQGAAAWASSPSVNNARDAGASAGTQTAALYFCGRRPTVSDQTESWNGTTWTNLNNTNTAREYLGGAGIQTAALAIATLDQSPNLGCETWDGTCWAEGNNVNYVHGGGNTSGGIVTAAIVAGGGWPPPSPYFHAESETYDGTCWTNTNSMSDAAGGMQGGHSYSSVPGAFGFGSSPVSGAFEIYDGTSWTASTSLSTSREQATGAGSNTAALAWGGNPGHIVNTEQWDGSSWTEMANLAVGRRAASGAGTYTAALSIAGETPPGSTKNSTCEAFNDPVYTIKTVTVS